jgi:hypothetical protein
LRNPTFGNAALELLPITAGADSIMSTKIVGDGLIEQATLYRPVFWLLRLDVLPFVCLYAIFFGCALSKIQPLVYAGLIALPILFALHLFLFLMAQWSVKVRCMLGYTLVSDIKAAQIVRVMAAQNAGADRLARLAVNSNLPDTVSVNILGKAYAITKERLDFQKVTYNFDADRNNFVRLEYPTSVPVKTMLDWRGHPSTQNVGLSLLRWGTNEYDIPIPNFLDLYLVSLISHVRVLLVARSLLSLDDYLVVQLSKLLARF